MTGLQQQVARQAEIKAAWEAGLQQQVARQAEIKAAWEDESPKRAERIKAAVEPLNDQESDHPSRQYTTKDSGKRAEYASGMVRDTQDGKPRFDLITPADQRYDQTMTHRHAMLMTRGAEKYGNRNWEKADSAEELERFKQSAFRHFMQWYHGELDEDHASAVYFNIAATEYVKGKLAMDKVVFDTLGIKPLEAPEHRACRIQETGYEA